MKFWSQWNRRRSSKRINKIKSRQLRSEYLEPRQLLAGDILQTIDAPMTDGAAALIGYREPRAALSLDARSDLSFEGDSNERRIASLALDTGNVAVAATLDGGFVVVRQQQSSGRGWDLYGQRYAADGSRVGSVFRVNAERRGDQINPQIAVADDGSFSVVFQSQVDNLGWEVMTRTFNADGTSTRTREFAVHSNGRGDQANPSVAYIGPATYVVVWNGRGHGVGADGDGIFAQRIAFNDPVGLPIRVNFHKDGVQADPVVATTPDNDFVIAWEGRGDGDTSGIYMRRFSVNDDGDVTRTREIRVNSLTSGADREPAISINPNDGSFVVAWQHYAGDEGWNIRAQAFDANLRHVGETVEVNQTTTHNQGYADVTHIDNDYVIVWEGYAAEDGTGIYARRFTAAGEAIGGEVLINNRASAGDQDAPAIFSAGDGIQIVWDGPAPDGRNGIYRRGLREADLNEDPVITDLPNVVTKVNSPFTFTVSVSDADTPPEELRITVRANNEAVVTVDENDPTLFTVTPLTDFEGRVNVSISVWDGVNDLVRERFTLEVSDNLPPKIAPIADIVIAADQEQAIVDYVVTDNEDDVDDEEDLRITRIIESGDARVRIDHDNSQLIVIPDSGFVGDIVTTLIAYDGARRTRETFTVSVSSVPAVDLDSEADGNNATATYFANAALGAQGVGIGNIAIADNDNATLAGARVQLNILDPGFEILSVSEFETGIVQSYNPANGILALTGEDTLANYQRVLGSLLYTNDALTPTATPRVLTVTVNDGVQDSEPRTAFVAIQEDVHVDLVELSQRIADAGTKFFGAHWCPACTAQKEAFEDGQKFLPFIEVTNPDRTPNDLGIEEGIQTYPTWEFPDGSRLEGQQEIGLLAALSGVDIPATPASENNTPFVFEIEEMVKNDEGELEPLTVLVGSPLLVPLDGYDADGDDLTYTISSSNPDIVPTIQEGNRSARINVNGFGDMVLELFEDKAPLATARMIELATSTTRTVTEGEGDDAVEMEIPFYQDITFHRVLNDFVIQAGDPDGTGSGGSDLGEFDDQFDLDLQHNRTGLLSMAKTDDDTNDSQFFITEGPSRHLDFNHTIFGILVEGESNREAISNTDAPGGRPTIDVVMEGIDIFEDNENAVLLLKANEGATGTSTITVTATDGSGAAFERTFEVAIEEDTTNGGPFLVPFDDEFVTEVNTPLMFDLDAIDIEGDEVFFDHGSVLADQIEIEINNETGEFTVTPATDFFGVTNVFIGVRPETSSDTTDRFDAQEVVIIVGDPERVFGLVERGSFDDDGLLGIRTDLVDGAPEITNDHVEEAVDYSDFSNPPTYGPHHGPLTEDGVSITPRPTGVYSTEQPDEDLVHNLEHGHVWISYNPSLISEADRLALESLVDDGGINVGVILTPRSDNTSVIALASWARLLTLESFDDAQIREFVETNRGHAPEGYRPSGQKPDDREVFDDGLPHLP